MRPLRTVGEPCRQNAICHSCVVKLQASSSRKINSAAVNGRPALVTRAGGESCHQRRPVAASGGGPIWGGHQHGDQLGTALPPDRQRQAGPDRRLSAKEDCWTASRLAGATKPGSGFYRARAGGRTRRAWSEG